MTDRLTIEDCERLIAINKAMNYGEKSRSSVYQQLADALRENEELKFALSNKE